MEKDISWAKHQEDMKIAFGNYINYLIEKSVFVDIYENLLKEMEYPQIALKPNTASLESIRNNVISNTRGFLNGVNLDIKWLDKGIMEEIKRKYDFDAHRYFMEAAKNVSIFDIPLIPSNNGSSYVDYHVGNNEDFKDVIFKRIGLLLEEDADIMEATYFHELGHALISRNWYMITNILFDEYVPHLLEMIYNYAILGDEVKYIKKLLQKMRVRARGNLLISKEHSYISLRSHKELIYSLALVLSCITFEKYIDFNKQDKEEMEKDVKDLLNGIITVEEFMKKYEINLDNDSSIKLYKRTVERVQSYDLK